MKYLQYILVATITLNIFLFWGTDAVYGWVVALAGWVPHLFDRKANHGN